MGGTQRYSGLLDVLVNVSLPRQATWHFAGNVGRENRPGGVTSYVRSRAAVVRQLLPVAIHHVLPVPRRLSIPVHGRACFSPSRALAAACLCAVLFHLLPVD